jgi:hypothetical protein
MVRRASAKRPSPPASRATWACPCKLPVAPRWPRQRI